MIFKVKFPNGGEVTVHAGNELAAKWIAFRNATQPVYCRIHEGIAKQSVGKVGNMGLYYPVASYPESARPMREVYCNGGYCLIDA